MTKSRVRSILFASMVGWSSVVVTIWYAVARGQDFNWDQLNYHIGIPVLLHNGMFWKSIDPAGIQSYFDPSVLQIQYWAIRHLSAISFVVMLAIVQSLAFVTAGFMCGVLASPAGGWKALAFALLGFALCLMAPVPLSEAGTTFIDLVTAVPVLAAYALLLTRGRWLSLAASGLLAGALLGMATALKLTNGVFVLGAAGFMLAGPDSFRQRLGWMFLCGTAATLAVLAAGGTWALELWRHFGSPIFPYYNAIFKSKDFGLTDLKDTRFLHASVFDIWLYPLDWLHPWLMWVRRLVGFPRSNLPEPSSELTFVDYRWFVAIAGSTLFLAALPFSRRWGSRRLAEPGTGLVFAFIADYLVWMFEFGIHRYLVVLDVLCGAVLLVLAMAIRPHVMRFGLLLLLVAVQWYGMVVPNWGHLPWQEHWQGINRNPMDIGPHAIVFLTRVPSLFVSASLSPDARYVGIYDTYGAMDLVSRDNTGLTRQLAHDLASVSDRHLYEVDPGAVPAVARAVLASYGLKVTGSCRGLQVATKRFRICHVARNRIAWGAGAPAPGER